ncbi:hypothetical protein KC717_06805, partial [Candidatus Dojkabacteria bacterium]|nr:hypothetical protein [Candidatus Dojkabacteria bacterium]
MEVIRKLNYEEILSVGIILYILGFVVSSIHLSLYNIPTHSLLSSRNITVGVTTLSFLVMLGWQILILERHSLSGYTLVFGCYAISFSLAYFVGYLFTSLFNSSNDVPMLHWIDYSFYIICFACFFLEKVPVKNHKKKFIGHILSFIGIILPIVVFLWCCWNLMFTKTTDDFSIIFYWFVSSVLILIFSGRIFDDVNLHKILKEYKENGYLILKSLETYGFLLVLLITFFIGRIYPMIPYSAGGGAFRQVRIISQIFEIECNNACARSYREYDLVDETNTELYLIDQ